MLWHIKPCLNTAAGLDMFARITTTCQYINKHNTHNEHVGYVNTLSYMTIGIVLTHEITHLKVVDYLGLPMLITCLL